MQTFDVVVVPFPYNDRQADKRRPAVVVSHRDLPLKLGRVWVAMVTSTPYTDLGDTPIADLTDAGLPVASTLRASKLATVEVSHIIRVAGRLSENDQNQARRALIACAGF